MCLDAQVPPWHLRYWLLRANPVHHAVLVSKQAEVFLVVVGDENVHQLPSICDPQLAEGNWLQRTNVVDIPIGMQRGARSGACP